LCMTEERGESYIAFLYRASFLVRLTFATYVKSTDSEGNPFTLPSDQAFNVPSDLVHGTLEHNT